MTFDNVLLTDDKGNVTIGAPAIKGASVTAQILSHLKGDKVIVFKKKRRKGYRVKNGHRQALTELSLREFLPKEERKKLRQKQKLKKQLLQKKKRLKKRQL